MKTFRIGDFLTAEGEALSWNIQAGEVFGFTRLRLRDGETVVEFEAAARAQDAPPNLEPRSAIRFKAGDVASQQGAGDDIRIELKPNREAFASFHWPNPLTPLSAGLFFRLAVVRADGAYRLNFHEDPVLATRGYLYFRQVGTGWEPVFLRFGGPATKLLAEVRDAWIAGLEIAAASARSIRGGVLLSGPEAALIESEDPRRSWSFVVRLAAATESFRLVAEVNDGNPDDDREALAVSARALRLEERPEFRPRPLWWRRTVTLSCASFRTGAAAEPRTWFVDWTGVPTFDAQRGRDHLSLRCYWQELARHWPLGLRSLRSRNALTFLPTDLTVGDPSLVPAGGPARRWTFRFQVAREGGVWRSRLARVGSTLRVPLRFELASVLDSTGRPCAFDAAVTNDFEALSSISAADSRQLFGWTLGPSPQGLGELLVGGVLLDVGKLTDGSLKIDLAESPAGLGQPPLAVFLDLHAEGRLPRPGTEDPERGFETENDLLRRERPLVIDLAPADGVTRLAVQEQAHAGRSRVLELTVQNTAGKAVELKADVVVVDPHPFLVSRVQAGNVKVEKNAILAAYRDDGERLPGWEFRTETGRMTLVLPPQAFGEEMIKGKLTVQQDGGHVSVPFKDRPFDFRLSPPARLGLDRTDIDTARTAPPWTLRRLLDRREGVVGLKLESARFELLYGLTSVLEEAEGLRIAEQEAFVGRVPIPPALRDRVQERLGIGELYDPREVSYAKAVVDWVRGLLERPAQMPVFRDFAARERLVLSRGLSFEMRGSRQTAHPLRIDKYRPPGKDFEDPDHKRLPLRGGVDYPFESQNIYDAVLTNPEKAKKGEAQGQVAGLVFGALGGSGSQQASFDEGRTLIISETTHGRLSSLTVVRVGRIAMLWNHARHVIVYERTTRTAPRYREHQPADFEGLAALRKVKEYVEITQPRRVYPDFAPAPGAVPPERPLAGPLTASAFETVVIPVKSSWGRDIRDGWVMALRGPLSDQEKPFYPVPKIFLELARAKGKGEGAVNHLASDPGQLLFFSTTRQGLGGDPDAWPAWPDVDFPLTHRPEPPQLPFLPGFRGANRQPDAAEHDYGQRRFTIEVMPPEEAVNLMHGRPGDGLEARVRNVSLLRGQVPRDARSAVDEAVGKTFAAAEAAIADGLSELAQHLERLAQEGAGRTAAQVEGLREQARDLLGRAEAAGQTLQDRLRGADDLVQKGVEDWEDLQQRWQSEAAGELAKALGPYRDQLQSTLESVVQRLSQGGSDGEAENRLRGALETVCRQAAQRLEGLPFLPAEVLGRLEAELDRAEAEVRGLVDGVHAGWLRLLDELAARFAAEDPRALEEELIDALLAARARLAGLGAEFARLVKDRLGPLFGDLPGANGAVGRLTAAVDGIVLPVTEAIDEVISIVPPFDLTEPDWARLRELLEGVLPAAGPLLEEVRGPLLADLRTGVEGWRTRRDEALRDLATQCSDQARRLVEALGQGVEPLAQAVGGVVAGWAGHVDRIASELGTAAQQRFQELSELPAVKALEGAIDRSEVLQKEVMDRIGRLRGALDGAQDLRELAAQAREAARQAGAGLRRIGEQVEQAVASELRETVQTAEGAALQMARALAEGPVTDTLRCTRAWVGYYYDAAREALDVTRAAAVFNDLGNGVLNSLSAQVPFDRIRDRLLAQLGGFDLNKLFPDFAGLKLDNLLGGVKIPDDPLADYDWIKMRHGFDRTRLTAWSEVAIDKRFEGTPELFTLPPVALRVEQPRFTAKSRVEASKNGLKAQQTEALLVADWTVTLNGQPIMTIQGGGLYFDSGGGFRFDFEAQNLRLAPALQFVTDALRGLLPQEEGLTLTPLLPGGVSVELSLPLPDIGTGAFTLTAITLYCHFDLLVAGGFEVRTGAWLSRPERPFGMAVLFLGGGGWFGVDVRYKPPREFETRVSLGLSAGAFVAINFGVARGSAGVLFTVGLDFYRNWLQSGSQDLAISIGILVWGEFSILSIVSAYLRVVLRVEYRNGAMTGYGQVSVSIRICWCFTLRVDKSVRLPFKGGGRSASRSVQPAMLNTPPAEIAVAPRPPVLDAVNAHFANLDL